MQQSEIRPVQIDELPQFADLLDAADCDNLRQWTGFVPRAAEISAHTFGDRDAEAGLILGVWEAARPVAWAMGVRRPWKQGREDTGYVKFVFVREEARRRGIGRRLLQAVETALAARGAAQLLFGSAAPSYLFAGVPTDDAATRALLRAAGWQEQSERLSLHVDLRPAADAPVWPDPGHGATVDFELVSVSTAESTLAFVRENFSESWAAESEAAVRGQAGAFCTIARVAETRSICGFAAVGSANPGWFGPMGVRAARRGSGIGAGLMRHAIAVARDRGMASLFLSWVNDKEGFYRRFFPDARRQAQLKAVKTL